jgi:hypothetical protein
VANCLHTAGNEYETIRQQMVCFETEGKCLIERIPHGGAQH